MSAKVLVVDDEPPFVAALSNFLTRHSGYAVDVAFDGRQALQRVQEGHPDLAIVDLKLPDVSAEEFIQQLQHVSPGTKVMIITAYRDETLQERFLRQPGVVGYLFKPIPSLLELERQIQVLLK